MGDELIDIVDKNGKKTKLIQSKKYAHRVGLWHNVIHVWVYNSKGEVLLQKRSMNKHLWPGKWDISVGGHIGAGENIEKAAVRETFEEVGIRATTRKLEKATVWKAKVLIGKPHDGKEYHDNREFVHVYFLKYESKASGLRVQKSEVDEVKFVPLKEFVKELNNKTKCKQYAHNKKYYMTIIKILEKKFK